ncbi:hypothetical protein BHM03_00046272 [Ensete ventricosum]|nr:hypothetical protein BHM03_00046272 [Ensete ventricosum]
MVSGSLKVVTRPPTHPEDFAKLGLVLLSRHHGVGVGQSPRVDDLGPGRGRLHRRNGRGISALDRAVADGPRRGGGGGGRTALAEKAAGKRLVTTSCSRKVHELTPKTTLFVGLEYFS